MISIKEKPDKSEDIKKLLHPFVRDWFFKKFKDFSLPQLYSILEVHSRNNILISAPTGSGKTISSFLAILNELIDSSDKRILQDKIYAIYISPLKALNNDISKNLLEPLKEIEEIAGKKFGIRISVRTGDTTAAEKAKMLIKPPHILITTPESLAIVLNSIKFSDFVKNTDWCVVDEIHSLAENKRGVHLSLSLERLQNISPGLCRVGLSATISPLDEIAKYLVGNRSCKIIDARFNKNLDIKVISPVDDLINSTYDKISNDTYHLIDKLIHEHKTTLIFTNTRSGTERVVHHLKNKFPKKYTEITEGDPTGYSSLIGAHHGSLSKEHRFKMEEALRKGKLKCIVSSTSLELGIDIGYIDLVICLGSPKSIARLLQRCLPYDSRILLADGTYLPIGEIVENKLDVEVLSYDKDKGFIKNKIKEHHKNKSDKLLKFNLHSGLSLECTDEHPILTRNGWKEAKNISQGEEVAEIYNHEVDNVPYIYEIIDQKAFYIENREDFLRKVVDDFVKYNEVSYSMFAHKIGIKQNDLQNYIRRKGRKKGIRLDIFLKIMELCKIDKSIYINFLTEIKTKSHHRKPLPLKLTPEIMWLSGVVASDGCITKHKTRNYFKIKIGNKDIKLLEECQKIFLKYGFYSKIQKRKGRDFYYFDCGSKLLAEVMLSLGLKIGKEKSASIDVSNVLNLLPKKLIIPYIEGILEGDGNKDRNIRIFSASKKFVIGLHNLLNRCGIHNYFTEEEAKISKIIPKINLEKSYWLYIGRNNHVKEFLKYCIFKGKKAKFLRDKKYNYGLKDKDIENNIHWTKVNSIELTNTKNDFVYNITLENEPNTYFVESILTHNCGRAGHQLHSTVKGKIIATDRDDLVECCVMVKNAVERKIDRIHIPRNCLDVLAQQIIGMSLEQVWDINELYNLIIKSYCYKDLSFKDFNEILDYLSGEFASLEDRHVYARIWKNEGKIGKKGKLGRVIYMTNLGTIPDESFIVVKIKDHIIGHIDENFLEKLKPGDVFVLGGSTYEFKFSRGMVAQVISAEGKRPTIPSWFSEMLPLSFDLAVDIQKFRFLIEDKFKIGKSKKEILNFINEYLYLDHNASEAIFNYFFEQYNYLEIPNHKKIMVEHFIDEDGKYYIIFHSLFGRRVNDVLSRALAFAIGRNQHRDVEVGINDNGFYVSCEKRINAMQAFKLIKSHQLRDVLKLALDKSEVLKRRFRHCAARAFMILRTYKGQTKRVGRQQVSSMLLLSAVRRINDDFCILKEARREVLEDLMDINNATEIIKLIEDQKINIVEFNTRIPSPFAFNLVLESYSDILKMEDRQEFLKRMHENVRAKISLKK